MKKQPEFELQKSICKYLDLKYPDLPYLSDTIASVKLTIPQASRNKSVQKPNFKCPDLIIFQPNSTWAGLFLELKIKSPYLKCGFRLRKCDHLKGQQKTINDLKTAGYYACFSWSLDQTIEIIENYLNDKI